ncbi:MAG: enoyl-CoA hydratase, partial [Aquincola sp.]|nr:enoyl-CoA hydratase [Aquincola sp.]
MTEDKKPFQHYAARHFGWRCSSDGRVATVTLNRAEKKNPLTFESYAEMRDLF